MGPTMVGHTAWHRGHKGHKMGLLGQLSIHVEILIYRAHQSHFPKQQHAGGRRTGFGNAALLLSHTGGQGLLFQKTLASKNSEKLGRALDTVMNCVNIWYAPRAWVPCRSFSRFMLLYGTLYMSLLRMAVLASVLIAAQRGPLRKSPTLGHTEVLGRECLSPSAAASCSAVDA